MKPERIQERLLETPEWTPEPAKIERRWPCHGFLEATRLARLAERELVDSPVRKEIVLNDTAVHVRLGLTSSIAADALFEARDRLDAALGDGARE